MIADCEYFKVEKLVVNNSLKWTVDKSRFEIIIVCDGKVRINGIEFKKGETALIPAYIGEIELIGDAEILKTYVNV